MLRVSGIRLPIDDGEAALRNALIAKLGIRPAELLGFTVVKESIDARRRSEIHFVYTIDARVDGEDRVIKQNRRDVALTPDEAYQHVPTGHLPLASPPVVIGTGPAGLFAGLILAELGYCPLILERGHAVDTRTEIVQAFWEKGALDPECNVQFGEGGAGTFSDGKLTTQIRDRRCRKVLDEFVLAGAPPEIKYSHKPHVGTDNLRRVVKKIREKITRLGGEVRFQSKVSGIVADGGSIRGVIVNGTERIEASVVIFAIGHSARDTFAMLHDQGVEMRQKPFSIGVRIEHPQRVIDRAQYKEYAGHPRLGPADYKLAYHSPRGRSAYTFCMCPGGVVVAATSEERCVCTNGMSFYARDADNANSALLVGVQPGDYGSDHPLAGVSFQREWENKAYDLGGQTYSAPAQLLGDFLSGRRSRCMGTVTPSYARGVTPANLEACLPSYVINTMREAIPVFDRKLAGFAQHDAVLTGVETRSSSPVRISRNEDLESSVKGLYPAGEGAGYAGGIVSSALDGIRVAEAVARKYRPLCSPSQGDLRTDPGCSRTSSLR